jgi:hypothetical protein
MEAMMADSFTTIALEDADRALLRASDTITLKTEAFRAILDRAREAEEHEDGDFYDYDGYDYDGDDDGAEKLLGAIKKAITDKIITDLKTLNAWIAEREDE